MDGERWPDQASPRALGTLDRDGGAFDDGVASPQPRGGRAARVCVIYATKGRAETLSRTMELLATQTRRPDAVLVSATEARDVQPSGLLDGAKIIFGAPGLARQRNRALRQLPLDTDYVVFFDDDFLPHPRWIEAVERCFLGHDGIAAITGHVIADGIKGPGIPFAEGLDMIAAHVDPPKYGIIDGYSPYGCNMAFRRTAIANLHFDERLVLYSWLEDRDFGGALARRGGRLVKLAGATGVHLGVKGGRMSGRRLGYSQIVNPLYLHRKGTMTAHSLFDHLFRNLSSNLARSLVPEAHVDRHGRLVGNMIALRDLVTGSAAPERAECL